MSSEDMWSQGYRDRASALRKAVAAKRDIGPRHAVGIPRIEITGGYISPGDKVLREKWGDVVFTVHEIKRDGSEQSPIGLLHPKSNVIGFVGPEGLTKITGKETSS